MLLRHPSAVTYLSGDVEEMTSAGDHGPFGMSQPTLVLRYVYI
jgi:hypothetical protein